MPHTFDSDENLEEMFPNLRSSGWEETSPCDLDYNCLAFAGYDTKRPWDPSLGGYWPPGARKEWSLLGWQEAYQILVYETCESEELEPGFEKIAIYAKDGKPQHIARQEE